MASVDPRVVTSTAHRTAFTSRPTGRAELRAEVHKALIESPTVTAGEQGAGESPEPALPFGRRVVLGQSTGEPTREDPRDVCVHDRLRPVVGEGHHGASGVPTNARQLHEFRACLGEVAGTICDGIIGDALNPAASHFVAKRVSHRFDLPQRSMGNVFDRWEAIEEFLVHLGDTRDLCLVQHDLRNKDAIGVARTAPRQVAPVHAKPAQ